MYKKLKYFVLTAIIFLSGCSDSTSKSSSENQNSTGVGDSVSVAYDGISVKESYVNSKQAVDILKNIPNLTVSDNFFCLYTSKCGFC